MSSIYIKDRSGRSFLITPQLLKIGRALDNDVVINNSSVSRYHIALQPVPDGIVVFNTGSDSGFYINEQWFLDSAVARNGDVIRVGTEEFMADIAAPIKTEDFAFTSPVEVSKTGSLALQSKNRKRFILYGIILAIMGGIALLPDTNTKLEDHGDRQPASADNKMTKGLPNESYEEPDVPKMGPQELTAEDLYKRGMRELSNNNHIRAIQYFQQSLVEDPSLTKAKNELSNAEVALKNRIENLVVDSEKNYKDTRLSLSRSLANQALDLMSEQIPGFSFQVQQKQRTLASQKLPVLSREQIYIDLACDQTTDSKLCERAIEILKRSRKRLGEENVLK